MANMSDDMSWLAELGTLDEVCAAAATERPVLTCVCAAQEILGCAVPEGGETDRGPSDRIITNL